MADRIQVKVDADLADIAPAFIEKRKAELPELRTALEKRDFEFLKAMGHRLKGSAGGYGFDRLGALGAEIESGGRERDAARIAVALAELEAHLGKVEIVYVNLSA